MPLGGRRRVGHSYQADRSKPWDPSWGELLERFRAGGHLSDDRWARYASQAFLALTIQIRPSLRDGDPLPYKCDLYVQRLADPTVIWVDLREASRSCEIVPADGGRAVPVHEHRSRVDAADLVPFRPDGSVRRLVYGCDIEVGDGDRRSGFRTLATRRLVASAPCTVGPADRSPVATVPDPSLNGMVRRSLGVAARWEPDPWRGGPPVVVLSVDSDRISVDVSFGIWVRSAGREARVGNLVHGQRGALGYHIDFVCPPSVGRHQPLDVVFRTDPTPAAASTPDVNAVWAGEVAFLGVPID